MDFTDLPSIEEADKILGGSSMATYEDLFGSKGIAAPVSSSRYMKWEKDGETLLVELTGEPEQRDQVIDGKVKWLVRMVKGGGLKPMGEGDFDPTRVEDSFKPKGKDIVIPVRVVGKKDAGGNKVDSFEPFDSEWELRKGDMLAKTKAEMQETGHGLTVGSLIALKRLDSTTKPHTFSVKIVKAAE